MQKNTESHIKLKRLLGILCYLLWTNPVLSMVINQEQSSDVSHGAEVLSQTDNQLCNPGYVFQNNSCVSCTSKPAWIKYAKENRMFCGGVKVGEMNRQLKDQIQKCPAGAFPNSELTDCECGYGLESKDGKCVGSLSYDDMYYGPGGPSAPLYKQCWTKSHDEKAYKKCMGFDGATVAQTNSSATKNTPTTDTNDKTDSKNNIENNTSDEWAYNGLVESPYIFSDATHWTEEGRSDDPDTVDWSDELNVYWYYYWSSGEAVAKKQTGMTFLEAFNKQNELNTNGICELNPKIHLWKAVGVTATKGKQKINIDVIIGEAKCISGNLSDMGGTVCVCSVKSVSKGSIQKKWARGNPTFGFYMGDCYNNKAGICENTCARRCSSDFASDNENVRKLLMAWWKP